MKISATILAAGKSSRMGDDNKLLLAVNGLPMINRVCKTIISAGLNPVIVVTGFDHKNVGKVIPKGIDKIVFNSNWESGMASSIYVAVSSLGDDVDGNMIVLGDMPKITKETLGQLIKKFIFNEGDRIIYPIYANRQANPVIFPKKYFPEILSSVGDRGCKKVLKQYPDDAVGVPVRSDEVILDCDTKDDYFQITNKLKDYVQA